MYYPWKKMICLPWTLFRVLPKNFSSNRNFYKIEKIWQNEARSSTQSYSQGRKAVLPLEREQLPISYDSHAASAPILLPHVTHVSLPSANGNLRPSLLVYWSPRDRKTRLYCGITKRFFQKILNLSEKRGNNSLWYFVRQWGDWWRRCWKQSLQSQTDHL